MRRLEPGSAPSNADGELTKIRVFLAYRRADHDSNDFTRELARRLENHRVLDDAGVAHYRVQVYYDKETPWSADWTRDWQVYLKTSRAMLLVCSPAAAVRRPDRHDFLHEEIETWLRLRGDICPILVDVSGVGHAAIPETVRQRWPLAQRLEGRDVERMIRRIDRGILISAHGVDEQELRRLRIRDRGLLVLVGFAFLLIVGLGIVVTLLDQERRRAEARTVEARDRLSAVHLQDGLVEDERRDVDLALVHYARALSVLDESAVDATNIRRTIAHALRRHPRLLFDDSRPEQTEPIRSVGDLRLDARPDPGRMEGPDGRWVRRWVLKVVRPDGGTEGTPFVGHDLKAYELSRTRNHILAAGMENEVVVWDWKNGTRVLTSPIHLSHRIVTATFSPNGLSIVTTTADDAVRLWDAETGAPIAAPIRVLDSRPVATFIDNDRIIVNDEEVWDTHTNRSTGVRHEGGSRFAAFDRTGRYACSVGWSDGLVHVFEKSTLDPVCPPIEHRSFKALFAAEGTRLVTAGESGGVRIWKLPSGKLVTDITPERRASALAVGPRGREIAIGRYDGHMTVADASTGEIRASRHAHEDVIDAITFGSSGRVVVTGARRGEVALWSVRRTRFDPRWKIERKWSADSGEVLLDLESSPDGTRVATGGEGGTAVILSSRDGSECHRLDHADSVQAVRFDHRGRRLVTAMWNRSPAGGAARVWNVATGDPLTPALRHEGMVWDATFSGDGRMVATVCSEGTARVWDTETGRPLTPFLRHRGNLWSVVFSPDDRWILTASTVAERAPRHHRDDCSGAWLWELPIDERAVEDIECEVEFLARRALDSTGHLFDLDDEEITLRRPAPETRRDVSPSRGDGETSSRNLPTTYRTAIEQMARRLNDAAPHEAASIVRRVIRLCRSEIFARRPEFIADIVKPVLAAKPDSIEMQIMLAHGRFLMGVPSHEAYTTLDQPEAIVKRGKDDKPALTAAATDLQAFHGAQVIPWNILVAHAHVKFLIVAAFPEMLRE